MKFHRFILDVKLKPGALTIEDSEFLNQVRNVLRLKVGERVILSDGQLNEAEAIIADFEKNSVSLEISNLCENKIESDNLRILYCSVLKKENFELVCQKATEVGISKIAPVVSSRTVKLNLRYDRLNKIIKEAAEQSGRGIVPELSEIKELEIAIEEAKKENDANVFLDPTGRDAAQVLENLNSKKQVGIFVGPEGGWTGDEIELAKENNFEIMSLGKTTLRAETAAIIGAYVATN